MIEGTKHSQWPPVATSPIRKQGPRRCGKTTGERTVVRKRLVQKPAIVDVIATSLEEDIVLGRRHPRERLIEQDLCDQFSTHRGDVRLALFELEKKGIVHRIPNRGAIVRDLTPKEVMDIYAVREEVEVMAARILPFPVDALHLISLMNFRKGIARRSTTVILLTVFYTNLHFHQTLFGLCGNSCLIDTIDHLAQKVYGIRSYANAFPDALNRARRDHVAMIEALRHSRRDDLIALTRRHLEAFARGLYSRLRTSLRRGWTIVDPRAHEMTICSKPQTTAC